MILPGSGDTFSITVSAGGQAAYKIEHDGRAGDDNAPGAAAVIAAYARLLGHPPSQDELAGFLAARVAGGALSGGAATPATQVTAYGADGQVLATGTPAALLAALATLVVLDNGVTPSFDLPDHPPLQNATEAAACLLGLTVHDHGAGGLRHRAPGRREPVNGLRPRGWDLPPTEPAGRGGPREMRVSPVPSAPRRYGGMIPPASPAAILKARKARNGPGGPP